MKILIALSRFPLPAQKGDKLRAWQQIQFLSEKFDITLICLSDKLPSSEELNAVKPFCKKILICPIPFWQRILPLFLGIFKQWPFQVSYFYSEKAKQIIRNEIVQENHNLCYVQLVRMGETVPIIPGVKYFMDYMDAMSKGMLNRTPFVSGPKKWFFQLEASLLKRYEKRIGDIYDGYSVITNSDAKALDLNHPEKLKVIPNGVDSRFFTYPPVAWEERPNDVLFSGNLAYFPNVEAAKFLVKVIMPLVWAELPETKVILAGIHPAAELVALESAKVKLTGFVPEMATIMQQSKVYVAPLFTGAGLQNKLLEAMAVGIPVITTPLANEALGAKPEIDLIICKDAPAFAKQILALLYDAQKAQKIAGSGRQFIETHYRWEPSNQILFNALLEISHNRQS